MWMEELVNGKYRFLSCYKDPYTKKWKRVSVTRLRIRKWAKKEALLDEKIAEKLQSLTTTDMLFEVF